MVRTQLPPYELMDVKNSLGSAIGMATGIALSETGKQVIALCGDSGFLHSGLNALLDAVQVGARFLLIILENGSTALSGGQPHPASGTDVLGRPRPGVSLADLARAAGVGVVNLVDLDAGEEIRPAIEQGLETKGVSVVIARGACPRWLPLGGATARTEDKAAKQIG
jgi:indolepyruvate ferredoxin oxidoreductase alpha subunit